MFYTGIVLLNKNGLLSTKKEIGEKKGKDPARQIPLTGAGVAITLPEQDEIW